MKVDMKIVPVEIEQKSGWFSKKIKKMHQVQFFIHLTEVEKAIINKAGLRDFTYLEKEVHTPDGTYSEIQPFPIWPWVDETSDNYGHCDYDTLIEAQAASQNIKANLTKLKEAMELHTETPTEESFEL